jgi:ABC-type Na+ efflux pump permease subunit
MREMALAATAESAAAREAETLRKELGIRSTDDVPKTALQSGTVQTESQKILIEVPADPQSAAATTSEVEEDPTLQGFRERRARQVAAGSADDGPELFLRQADSADVIVPTPLQQTVPGWALFAMFFLVVPLAQGLHRERSDGSIRRILSLAVPRSAIVLGKLCPYVLVGLLQFGTMLAVGLWVVPLLGDLSLEMGARPLVLVPIALACSLAATSYAMLVATWARTAEQAAAFGATSVVILSVLGGVMVPHFMMPQTLQDIAVASPIYWGHKACLDAFLHGASLAQVADSLTFLGGFAVVCMVLSVRRVTH